MSQNMLDDSIGDKKDLTIERILPMIEEVPAVEETGNTINVDRWLTFKTPLIWKNAISIIGFHLILFWGLLTFSILQHKLLTLWCFFVGIMAGIGVTGGAHRYWTHRTYKANLPLRIILMVSYLLAGMNGVHDWVRDHRVHHKYTESDADPHDSRRGLFFSHVGWLMMKKHPEVLRRGREIDMSDVLDDSVVRFSQKYFTLLKWLICFILPTVIPVYMWNEDLYTAIIFQCVLRYGIVLNCTWSVNSFAHLWGYRRYNESIGPAENKIVAYFSMGEGWHNYHHVFPWDYKAAELGCYWLNGTTLFIDFFAKIGWAWDLKTASEELIRNVTEKRGDGSHPIWGRKAVETSDKKHH